MATRMQQRRGTASQWTSSNDGDGPILNAGEIGWESDTNKFKIGDGVSYWADLTYFVDATDVIASSLGSYLQDSDVGAISGVAGLDASKNLIIPGASIIVEGPTDNGNETTLTVTDPTADRTITFPDATGTVQLRVENVDDTEIGYLNGVTSAIQTQMDAKAPLASPTFTGTVTIPAGASISGFAPLAAPALTGDATAVNLTLSGNLTVNGTTTTINSTTLSVDDKNIVIGDVATPSDSTADGGGITLKGATDKTFNWVDATDAWTSSEDLNLLTGKVYEIAGTSVLSATTLGSGVTGSSLTSVGTITSGTWNGTTIAVANGGTGITSFGSGVATFLGTPSSANFASMISDEIGTGNVLLSEAATSAQSASYTLVLADKAKVVEMSVGSANNLTVPLNSSVAFPTGTQIHIVQTGSGQTTVVATGGVTINTATTLKLRAQWSAATLIKRAENTWVLVGDLATS
jgi:hypothetical protein